MADKTKLEMLQTLTKQQIIRLLTERCFTFRFTQADIVWIKIDTLQKQQDGAFEEWKNYPSIDFGSTLDDHLKHFANRKHKEKLWSKYESIEKKISSLYAEIDRKRKSHATNESPTR